MTLLVLRLETIVFVVEPPIHLLLHHPFDNGPRQNIPEHGAEPGVEHGVPRIAIFRDPAHDPGAFSGADKYLGERRGAV